MRLFNFQRLAPLADRSRSLRPPLASHKSIFDIFFTAAVFFEKSCNFFCCFFSFAAQPHRYLVSASAPLFSCLRKLTSGFPPLGGRVMNERERFKETRSRVGKLKNFSPNIKRSFFSCPSTREPYLSPSAPFFFFFFFVVLRPRYSTVDS